MEKPKFHKPHIYIFNSSGCHGHYLTYLIDRLSKETPAIEQLPFNDIGNSHNKIDYSGFSKFVDSEDHEQNKNLKGALKDYLNGAIKEYDDAIKINKKKKIKLFAKKP